MRFGRPAGLSAHGTQGEPARSHPAELLQFCHLIQPNYFPILSVEEFEDRNLIVLWAPGGQNRPYKAPADVTSPRRDYHYYIRRYSSTVEAKGEDERELLRLTATIPFDDRQCPTAELDDLKPRLMTSFLKEIRSELARQAPRLPLQELARRMNLIEGAEEHARPRNVGLLFFNDEPTRFLPGAQIDVVLFPGGPGGRELIEKTFRGPLHEQIRDALRYIRNSTLRESVIKRADRAEAARTVNWPFPALEEALVNAVYHRSYELADPVEVRINPDVIEIVSYPGPDPSIRIEALNKDRVIARRYRKSPHRRVPQGTRPHGGPFHRHPADSRRDVSERLPTAPLFHGRRPDLLSGRTSRPPGAAGSEKDA